MAIASVDRTLSTNALDWTYIQKKVVPALEAALVLADYVTQPVNLPQGEGSTCRWIIPNNIAVGTMTNAITHASGGNIQYDTRDTINPMTWAVTPIEAQVYLYGGFIPVRKKDLWHMPKSTLDTLKNRVAYVAATVVDLLIRYVIDGTKNGAAYPDPGAGTTTKTYSIRNGTRDSTLTALQDIGSAEDIFNAWSALRLNDAQPFSNGLGAAILHEGALANVMTDVSTSHLTWYDANKYISGMSGQEKILKRSPGAIGGCMIVPSNNIGTGTITSVANSYLNIVLAADAVGTCGIGADVGNPVEIMVNESGPQSMSDPFRLYGTVSWQFYQVPKLLDSKRVSMLYFAP